MTKKTGSMSCALTCWLVALLGALFAAAILMLVGTWTFFQALFAAVVIFLIAGLLLSWMLCRPLPPLPGSDEDRASAGSAGQTASAASTATAAPAAAASPAAAPASAASAPAASAASAGVKPSASLPGQDDLASRKGTWRYDGDGDAASSAAATASSTSQATEESTPDYDGDGVLEGENEGTRPAALDGPRDGKADNLKEIKGIGPKLEKLCNALGFYHFDQIANWTPDEVAWVNANLEGFKGRVTRDTWVEQATILAAGGDTEFSKKVEKGGVYD